MRTSMDLRTYLFKNRITQKAFAEILDYSHHHIHNYLHKRLRVSPKLARKIEKVTNGEVTAKEVLDHNPVKKSNKEEKS